MAPRGSRNNYTIDLPSHSVSFDRDAFNEGVATAGVRLVHYSALPCPVGQVVIGDNRRPHEDHVGCSNGFIYRAEGTVSALMTSNSKHKNQEDVGFWDGSTVSCTFATDYIPESDCTTEDQLKTFLMTPFDRFYLDDPNEDIPVVQFEKFTYSPTGMNRLKFPAVKVLRLEDANGVRYSQGEDFVIQNGNIEWIRHPGENLDVGPGFDGNVGGDPVVRFPGGMTRDRGVICSIRYTYRPYWYVGQLIHELRVAQIQGEGLDRHIERMPQAAVLHREYVTQTAQARDGSEIGEPDGVDSAALRQVLAPLSGGFGGGR